MHLSAFHELDKERCQLPTVTECLQSVSKHVYVVFDASGFGLCAVLLQKHRQMMAVYSYRLCEVEQQGPIWEEELLEVVMLLGRRHRWCSSYHRSQDKRPLRQ